MRTIKFFYTILIWLLTCSCVFTQNYTGSGNVTKQERKVNSFNTLNLGGVFDITIIPSVEEKVIVETDDNLQQLVIVENHDSTLVIKMKECSISKKKTGKIYIYAKKLRKINNSCIGNIDMDGVLKGDGVAYHSNVVGNVFLSIEDTTINNNEFKEMFEKLKLKTKKQ